MNKSVKIFAIVVISIAALVFVMSKLGGNNEPESASPLGSSVMPGVAMPAATTATPMRGNDFATLLSSIKSITIDTSIFDNPAYKALRDHPIILGSDTVGRVNPFAPVGTDASAGGTTEITVQTVQPGKVTSTTAEFAAQVSFSTTAPVTVVFQYGTTDTFGSATPPITLTKSGAALQVVRDLQPNTTYYVQAVAVVGSTTKIGNIMTFTTTTPPRSN